MKSYKFLSEKSVQRYPDGQIFKVGDTCLLLDECLKSVKFVIGGFIIKGDGEVCFQNIEAMEHPIKLHLLDNATNESNIQQSVGNEHPKSEKEIELYLLLKEMERLYSVLRRNSNEMFDMKLWGYQIIRKMIDLNKKQYIKVMNDENTPESDIEFLKEFNPVKI